MIVNHYSASASEIVAACLQDHHRAVIVGERSWGKGSVQNVIELEKGTSALKLTTASYHRPSGKNIHRFPGTTESEWGVMPDPGYEVKFTPAKRRIHGNVSPGSRHPQQGRPANQRLQRSPARQGAGAVRGKLAAANAAAQKPKAPGKESQRAGHQEGPRNAAPATSAEYAALSASADRRGNATSHDDGLLLAIESSCDETAAAVIDRRLNVLSNVVSSQDELHRQFRGRGAGDCIAGPCATDHSRNRRGASASRACLDDLTAVAVTSRPGLVGSLLVGLTAAKTLALVLDIPLVDVNHVEAHLFACRMSAGRDVFPAVGLVVSGGHTLLFDCPSAVEFDLLGSTIDDAAGEAFDKGAKLLGLGYPGGPAIQRAAGAGNSAAVAFRGRCSTHRTRFQLQRTEDGPAVRNQRVIARPAGAARALIRHASPTWPPPIKRRSSTCSSRSAGGRCTGQSETLVREEASRPTAACASVWRSWPTESIELMIAPPDFCTDNAAMAAMAWEHLDRGRRGTRSRRQPGPRSEPLIAPYPPYVRRCRSFRLSGVALADEGESEDFGDCREVRNDGEPHVTQIGGDHRGGCHHRPLGNYRDLRFDSRRPIRGPPR